MVMHTDDSYFVYMGVCHGAGDRPHDERTTFTAIIQVNLRYPAPPVKNWRILLVQSFTVHMPLLMATSAFRLGRRRWSSHQQCYLLGLRTYPTMKA